MVKTEKQKADARAYYQAHKEELKVYHKAYYQANREHWIAKAKEYRATKPEVGRASSKKYREKNKEKFHAWQKRWRDANPEKSRDRGLRARFGITHADYMRMWNEQGGVCAICMNPETSTCRGKVRRLAVDHCHTTGKVRALLCEACNRAIGLMRESPERLEAAARYVRRHGLHRIGQTGT